MLKEIDRIRFFFYEKNFQNFQIAVIAMVTLEPCNLMLGRYMRKSHKSTR